MKLNQNENPYDLPEAVKRRVVEQAMARSWSRYPDFDPQELLEKLAAFAGWRADGVLAGNGSNELIEALLLVTVGPGTRVLVPEPTFTLYALLTKILGGEVLPVKLGPELEYLPQELVARPRGPRSARHDRLLAQQPDRQLPGARRRGGALRRQRRPGGDRRGVPRVRRPFGGAAARGPSEPRRAAYLLEGDGHGRAARRVPAGVARARARGEQGAAPVQPELLRADGGAGGARRARAAAGAGRRAGARPRRALPAPRAPSRASARTRRARTSSCSSSRTRTRRPCSRRSTSGAC